MHSAPSPIPRARHLFGRAIALALFALQATVVLSTIADSARTDRTVTHVEERGSTHPHAHDEATCALCAVRSLHAAVAVRACSGTALPEGQEAPTLVALAAPAPDAAPDNHSRAPPLAG